jgi:ATP-binding cassette subfamily B protein
MDRLLQSSTSFVIAHRLSTIKNADRILVIEDGEIQEMGSHAELIRKGGKYFQLYTKQFRQEAEASYALFGEDTPSPAAT